MRYENIKSDRQFRAVTGMPKDEFQDLLKAFIEAHESIFGKLSDRVPERIGKLKKYEDCLLFVLFQMKTNLTYDALGAVFNMEASVAYANFTKYSKILEIALHRKKVLPKRKFESKAELEETLKDEDEIIIDAEEHPVQRPKDPDSQKDMYSGKKKHHTNKTLIITNPKKWIYFVSSIHCGSKHDFTMLKEEFSILKNWFNKFRVILDLGFLGFEKLYNSKELLIPHKKKRKKKGEKSTELTEEQKTWNKAVSRVRVYVEHGIGGMKRYRILGYKNRMKNNFLKNRIIGICAGLWNYKMQYNGC